MKWFTGSVEEAIREKTTAKALLLVHVSDEGADSNAMEALWEGVDIKDIPVVALKLTAETPSFKQFTQFYPVVAIPSAYFIGLDGKVIEAVVGLKQASEVPSFVMRAVENFKFASESAAASTSAQSSSAAPTPAERVPRATSSPPRSLPTAAASASEEPPSTRPSERPSGPSATAIEERLQRARQIVEQREQQRDREDELRRRNVGAEMAKIREEYENKQREADAEERRKQKDADKIHMEKLRKQIEEDRVEKAARFNAERQRDREAFEEKARAKAEEAATAAAKEQAARASVARIQFKLPDGSSVVKQFEPSDKLRVAHDFSRTLIPNSRSGVTLASVTPRRTFSATDMDLTLADLTLAPSSVLIVTRSDGGSQQSGGGSAQSAVVGVTNIFTTMLASLYGFVMLVWAYIAGFIWAQPAVTGPNTSTQSTSSTAPTRTTSSSNMQKPSSSSSSPQDRPASGKVYRLHDLKRDDDADKATWNGNSTNQM